MKSCYRLKKNYQYNYVYKHAQVVSDQNFVLLYCKSNRPQSQVGFSIGKKYGHAVARNRLRRQMKAAVSFIMPTVASGFNVVLVPRKNEPYLFCDIEQSVRNLFEKAGLMS